MIITAEELHLRLEKYPTAKDNKVIYISQIERLAIHDNYVVAIIASKSYMLWRFVTTYKIMEQVMTTINVWNDYYCEF